MYGLIEPCNVAKFKGINRDFKLYSKHNTYSTVLSVQGRPFSLHYFETDLDNGYNSSFLIFVILVSLIKNKLIIFTRLYLQQFLL